MHRHTADDVCALTQTNTGQTDEGPNKSLITQKALKKSDFSSPGRVELPFVLCVSVAVNSDDAHCWAGCVGDYDWLGQGHTRRWWGYIIAAEKRSGGYTPTKTWKKEDVKGLHK